MECAPKYNKLMRDRVPELFTDVKDHPKLMAKIDAILNRDPKYTDTFKQACLAMPMYWGILFLYQNGVNYYDE